MSGEKKYEASRTLEGDINAKRGGLVSLDPEIAKRYVAKGWLREWNPKGKKKAGLEGLKTVGKDLFKKLRAAGIHTIAQLQNRSVEELQEIPGIGEGRAKDMLNEVADL